MEQSSMPKVIAEVIGGEAKEEQELIAVRVPERLLEKFDKICERQGVSRSAGLRNLMQWAVKQGGE